MEPWGEARAGVNRARRPTTVLLERELRLDLVLFKATLLVSSSCAGAGRRPRGEGSPRSPPVVRESYSGLTGYDVMSGQDHCQPFYAGQRQDPCGPGRLRR